MLKGKNHSKRFARIRIAAKIFIASLIAPFIVLLCAVALRRLLKRKARKQSRGLETGKGSGRNLGNRARENMTLGGYRKSNYEECQKVFDTQYRKYVEIDINNMHCSAQKIMSVLEEAGFDNFISINKGYKIIIISKRENMCNVD